MLYYYLLARARLAKLANALDLGSSTERFAGSSPAPRTIFLLKNGATAPERPRFQLFILLVILAECLSGVCAARHSISRARLSSSLKQVRYQFPSARGAGLSVKVPVIQPTDSTTTFFAAGSAETTLYCSSPVASVPSLKPEPTDKVNIRALMAL